MNPQDLDSTRSSGLNRLAVNFLKSPLTPFGFVIAGLALRILVIFTLTDPWISGPDAKSYVQSGLDLNSAGFLANSAPLRTFPVGYALILSPFLRLETTTGGHTFLLIQSIFFAACLIYFIIVARKYLNSNIILLVVALASFSPALIDATTSVQYEGILVSLSFALLAVLIKFFNEVHGLRPIIMLLLTTGLMTFIHPRMGLVALVVAIAVFMRTRKAISSLTIVLINLLAAAVLVIRNFFSTGTAGLSFNLGTNWYLGLPGINDACRNVFASHTTVDQSLPSVDTALQNCSVSWIASNPLEWLQLIPIKLLAHFEPFIIRILGSLDNWNGKGRISSWEPLASEFNFIQVANDWETKGISFVIAIAFALTLFGLVFIGLRVMISRDPAIKFLGWTSMGIVAVVAVPSLFFFGMLRFRIPSSPFLLLLIAFGIQQIFVWIGKYRKATAKSRTSRGSESQKDSASLNS